MQLEELKGLQEANGLLILTTADDDGIDDALIGNGFSVDIEVSDRSRGVWWLYRCAGDYEANLRYYSNKSSAPSPQELRKKGFRMRIDFFVNRPTQVVHDVVVALLKKGFCVASPRPAGTHIMGEWEIFKPMHMPAK